MYGRACLRFSKITPILIAYCRHIRVQAMPDGGFRIFLNIRDRPCWITANSRGGYLGAVFRSRRHNAENVLAHEIAETALHLS